MAAEEYSPDDPFDESPPIEMKYLKNPKKMTITEFELLPKKSKKLIASKNLEEGKIYYIEDVGRRKKDYREVYQGMYFPDPYSKDNKTLTFKYVSIIVAPFGDGGMPFGFPKKNHKFYEVTSIPNMMDHSRFKDTIKDMNSFINTQKAAPVEEGETSISFIGKDYRKSKKNFSKSLKKAYGKRRRKTFRNAEDKKKSRPQKSKQKQTRKKNLPKRLQYKKKTLNVM
tara:strand:+ start:1082 stop:1759 length:678 start_codon:yes stop_codon:yes gene_type:complete